jgi:peptidyl-prolyl cis-trans isomerase SurA
MLSRFVIGLIAGLVLMAGSARGFAQEVDRIAAVVNDEIISIHDLEARLKLAITISNLPDTLENRRRAVPQVLRKMVDERLQMQEANRVKVSVASDEINRSIANIERQNKMPPGGLLGNLAKAGVDTDAVKDQIRADITWMKLTGRMLGAQTRVGEEEITDRLETLRQQLGRPEYMLAEIFLNVDNPRQEEESRKLGERLMEQLRQGAPFPALARQFSQSATAPNGGMMGWVVDANLDDDIKGAVSKMEKGEVSPLIRTAGGFTVIAVVDKRLSGAASAAEESLSLVKVFFPYPKGEAIQHDRLAAKATDLSSRARSCSDFEDLGRSIGPTNMDRQDNVRASDLPEAVRAAVNDLPIGKVSPPQNTNGGLLLFMVCQRTMGNKAGALPSRDVIRRQLEEEKLDLQSKRYIRDLRRAAFIDFRL